MRKLSICVSCDPSAEDDVRSIHVLFVFSLCIVLHHSNSGALLSSHKHQNVTPLALVQFCSSDVFLTVSYVVELVYLNEEPRFAVHLL